MTASNLLKSLSKGIFRNTPKELVFCLLVIVGGIIVIDGGIWLAHQGSTLNAYAEVLRLRMFYYPARDSWEPMAQAFAWVKAHHDGQTYQNVLLTQHIKFQYPMSSELLYAVADGVHLPWNIRVLDGISLICLLLTAATCGAVAMTLAKRSQWYENDRTAQWALGLVAALACLTYYPTIKGVNTGQVQVWLNCWFVLACYCWIKEKRLIAGLLVGAICLFKPQFGLFLVWGLMRRQWQFVIGWAAIVLPGELASLAVFGFADNVYYLSVMSFLSHHGEIYAPNQSLNGLLNRLVGHGVGVTQFADAFPPYSPVVYYGSLLGSVVFVAWGLFANLTRKPVGVIDLMTAALAFTIASPIAWEHHYGFLPIVFIVIGWQILMAPVSPQRTRLIWGLAIAYVASAHVIPPVLLPTSGISSLLQSYLFYAGILVLWLLYAARNLNAEDKAEPLFRPFWQSVKLKRAA